MKLIKRIAGLYKLSVQQVPILRYFSIILVVALILYILTFLKQKKEEVIIYAFIFFFIAFIGFALSFLIKNTSNTLIRGGLLGFIYLLMICFSIAVIGITRYLVFDKSKGIAGILIPEDTAPKVTLPVVPEEQKTEQTRFEDLTRILFTPKMERQVEILKMGYNIDKRNEFGVVYKKGGLYSIIEYLDDWDNGVVRYRTDNAAYYIDYNEYVKRNGFTLISTSDNDQDAFREYIKDSLEVTIGSFTNTKNYLIAISHPRMFVAGRPIFSDEYLAGKWGRVAALQNGTYEFRKNKTFVYNDSREGVIAGKWRTDKRQLILTYEEEKDKYGMSHDLSLATEIIDVESRTNDEINGTIKNSYGGSSIILRRRL